MDERNYWDKKHAKYAAQDWIVKPTIFATQVIGYFPKGGSVLELGAGQGQDTNYFVRQGFKVVAADFSTYALNQAKLRLSNSGAGTVSFQEVDFSTQLPFLKESFDVVYSHLALHYFDKNRTQNLFNEIFDILKPGGVFATLTNTVEDPEINNFSRMEEDYYLDPEGVKKRYFSERSMRDFTKKFEILILDAKGETYKDEIKTLIRFVGKKPL